MQSEKILELKELHISFTQYTRGLQRRTIENVCGLSFSTYAGEVTALVGASGSGKSLLAHAVMGLLPYNASMGRFFIVKDCWRKNRSNNCAEAKFCWFRRGRLIWIR